MSGTQSQVWIGVMLLVVLGTTDARGATRTVCALGPAEFATIQAAHDDAATMDGDVIEVCAGVHTEAGTQPGPTSWPGGILITKDVVVRGQGQGLTIVQAASDADSAMQRVFNVVNASAAFENLTVRHGRTHALGGGIMFYGGPTDAARLVRTTVMANSADPASVPSAPVPAWGPGVSESEAPLLAGFGGGVCVFGALSVEILDSTINSNRVYIGGGGVYAIGGTGLGPRVTINRSTISANVARTGPGGAVLALSGHTRISNSTISGNETLSGTGVGGLSLSGSVVEPGQPVIDIVNATIARNTGTGLALWLTAGPGRVRNTLVAGHAVNCTFSDPIVTDGAPNLDDDGTCSGFSHSGQAADLHPLDDNGGLTLTHLPASSSAALDAADDAVCAAAPVSAVDQRGMARPQGARCDLGAVERAHNQDPHCDQAKATPDLLAPAGGRLRVISIDGVSDPDGDPFTLTVTAIRQDEPVKMSGADHTCPDGFGLQTAAAALRAERLSSGDGRVYHVSFVVRDATGGRCDGEVTVGVPLVRGGSVVDGGALYDSTVCP